MTYYSWGLLKKQNLGTVKLDWPIKLDSYRSQNKPFLSYGMGRSYGDSCLLDDGTVLETRFLNRFSRFDDSSGMLTADAGVSFSEILELVVPRGWFLPVTPGTKYVTLGGAIANDIHGKNHHVDGTFGCYVESLKLLRSSGEIIQCSNQENSELFAATIGGLGLTGTILEASFRLKKVESSFIFSQTKQFANIDEFLEINRESEKNFPYTVAWIDCLSKGKDLGRGVYHRGRHASKNESVGLKPKSNRKPILSVPFYFPDFVLNNLTVRAFNEVYFRKATAEWKSEIIDYEPFFYPLDAVGNWNRIYGKRGFFQHQFVIPFEESDSSLRKIMQIVAESGLGSFLSVLKTFGEIKSPGMLSFPLPGYTLTLDFANIGVRANDLMDKLDRIVSDCGGRVYPAKDARMSAMMFKACYPNWEKFKQYQDENYTSSFWERVTTQ